MSYELKNGKLEKSLPKNKDAARVLKFRVLAEVTVRLEAPAEDGGMKIVDAQLANTRLATHPDDNMSREQLAAIMANSDALQELAGVLIVEQVNRKRNPVIAPATGNAGQGRGPGGITE